ncbi:MAG TPA: serine dehydratase beta chain, partial [Spirochaetia bacterium]|nr:serine dehydratase beta chain [Spirochaetia bacterium]
MNRLPASIFNDVIGPVMRGPSSSHVAGAARIGSLVRQSLRGNVQEVEVEFDVNGSLAESYHGHGSDIGFASGILGMELTDESVPLACRIAEERGIDVRYKVLDYGAVHPGNYRITAQAPDGTFVYPGTCRGLDPGRRRSLIEAGRADGFRLDVAKAGRRT